MKPREHPFTFQVLTQDEGLKLTANYPQHKLAIQIAKMKSDEALLVDGLCCMTIYRAAEHAGKHVRVEKTVNGKGLVIWLK